jgi:hypothetical protein
MRKFLEFKALIIVLALAGLAGLSILAAALREARFQPPGPLPFAFEPRPGGVSEMLGPDLPFLYWIFFAVMLVMTIGLLVALLNPKTRKRALLALLRMSLTMLAMWWIINYSGLQILDGPPAPVGGLAAPGEGSGLVQSPPEFTPPQVSPWLGLVISFVVGLVVVALAWLIASRRSKSRRSLPLTDLAGIARQALDGLQDGRNWDDAIIQAYIRMNDVVTTERGLLRQPGVTPYEFAVRLEQLGLPGEAARTLTRLFEQVRYGGQPSTRQERDLAAAALNAIVRACGTRTGREAAQ